MIVFENVSKMYDDGFKAVNSLNLTIGKGELVTLIGPSGCGKTTTMKMINKLIEPSEGSIKVNGADIATIDGVGLRRNIGYVIQQIGLLPHMTVGDNIALIPKLKGWTRDRYEKRVDEMLELVGLEPEIYKRKFPLELSGGQQQRVGVVRALAAEPPIVLMDEPFSALDPISREQLQDELKILQRRIQKTIVFVTHDIDEAIKIADRIGIMKDGGLVQIDSPNHLLENPANDFVREFIGESRLKEPVKTKQTIGEFLIQGGKGFVPESGGILLTVEQSMDLTQAVDLLIEKEAPALNVIDSEKNSIGIITTSQLLRYYADLKKERMN
ncbi:MAG TPA: glycine/betaine ABC transporter ATP-binding protein [Bacillus bacterium]|nr:glycine/betaine ABC transporter ATP-binding protein [Bacillus sp. (in: firmicutes)]